MLRRKSLPPPPLALPGHGPSSVHAPSRGTAGWPGRFGTPGGRGGSTGCPATASVLEPPPR